MYNSGITVASFLSSIRNEADISIEIPQFVLTNAVNIVEQFVYSEILNEYVCKEIEYSSITDDTIDVFEALTPTIAGCDGAKFDDIVKVFADDVELEKTGIIGSINFPEKDMYYNDFDGNLKLILNFVPKTIKVVTRLRPEIVTNDNVATKTIMLPLEFIDIAFARARGEAYKIANEDGLAAKWLTDYNAQLESFKIWSDSRNNRYNY